MGIVDIKVSNVVLHSLRPTATDAVPLGSAPFCLFCHSFKIRACTVCVDCHTVGDARFEAFLLVRLAAFLMNER